MAHYIELTLLNRRWRLGGGGDFRNFWVGMCRYNDGDWLRKRQKSFIALFPSRSVHHMSAFFFLFFLELNSKTLYHCSGKEKGSHCFVFTSSRKRRIRYFHVVVLQRRSRNVQKSVMLFCQYKPIAFCRSRCCPASYQCLSSLIRSPSLDGLLP